MTAIDDAAPARYWDPELEPLIPLLPVSMDWTDMPAARAAMAEMVEQVVSGQEDDPRGVWEARAIPGPGGAPDIPVRIYRPKDATGQLPGVIYLHGGGFCVGSHEIEHGGSLAAAIDVGAVVVSVDYRLAPEHPYPAPVEDCVQGLVWLAEHAGELGVDVDHLAVMGSSAGGGLAAGTALLNRDRSGPPLAFQALGIPELDDRLETPSMRNCIDTPLWNRPMAEVSWRYYLGELQGETPIYAAPARATDLAGLPPAYISTMEHDPLRDEGILYGLALLHAGVSVELHSFPGTFHGSSLLPTSGVAKRMGREMHGALRRALHGTTD